MKKSLLFLSFFLLFTSLHTEAQQYVLDPSFNIGTGFNSNVSDFVIQPDGKIIVVGAFTSYRGTPFGGIVRLNQDGTIDTSFNTGSGADGLDPDFIKQVVLQSDGKILICGSFTFFNGTTKGRIIRLNSNGSIDTSFNNSGAGANGDISSVKVKSDGKIIILGAFTSFNGVAANRIAQLNANGTRDTSFVIGNGFNNSSMCAVFQQDGKLIVGGSFNFYNNAICGRIVRLNTNGSQDTSFNPAGTGPDFTVRNIALESDGKILITGSFSAYNDQSAVRIARLNADGTLNTGLVTGADSTILDLKVQPDNKILIAGSFNSYNSNSSVKYLARLNFDLTLDTSFSHGNGLNAYVNNIEIYGDKLFIGGLFTTFSGSSSNRFALLTPQVNPPLILTGSQTAVSCFGGNNGEVSVTASGGVPPYSYQWSGGPAEQVWSDVTAGTYTITVSDSAEGSATISVTVLQPTAPLTTTITALSNATCYGVANGAISVTISGGTPPYRVDESVIPASTSDTNIPAGNYGALITDNKGCQTVLSFTITQPDAVPAPTGSTTQTINVYNSTDATLANLIVTGDNILWYASLNDAEAGPANALPIETQLVSGTTYYATQTINGCESPTALGITATVTLSNNEFVLNTFTYYPNPAKEAINLKSDTVIDAVTVYNLLGQELIQTAPKRNQCQLDLSKLPAATYLMRILIQGETNYVKFIKQ